MSILTLKKYDSIRDEDHFGGWIRKAARLEALNALRKKERTPKPLGDVVLDMLDAEWNAADAEPVSQRLEALRVCLERLTPRARHIVELRYTEGLNCAEVAEQLGRPLNTIYVALSRIHRTLAECIRRRTSEEGGNHV